MEIDWSAIFGCGVVLIFLVGAGWTVYLIVPFIAMNPVIASIIVVAIGVFMILLSFYMDFVRKEIEE